MDEQTTRRLTPTAQRIFARVQTEGVVSRTSLGPMRSGGYYTAAQKAILALLDAQIIRQEPMPEHAGRVQYRLAQEAGK